MRLSTYLSSHIVHTFFGICVYKHTRVAITDNASVMFGGDADAPAAFGNVYSLGAINMENNGQITKEVTELLEPFGLDQGRIYINFFDMDRANIGWNKRTFAG